MIRVVVAEDSFLVRDGLIRLLDSQPDIEVVGVGVDYDDALAAVDAQRPDVLLTDIRMPPTRGDEGIKLAEHCRRAHPAIGVLLLSRYVEPGYVKALLSQGTDGRGYLLKERVASADDLVYAVRAINAGRFGDRSEGRRITRPTPRPRRGPNASAASARANAKCSVLSLRAGPTPQSRSSSCSPRKRWRSTSTRSSRNSDSPVTRTCTRVCARPCCTCPRAATDGHRRMLPEPASRCCASAAVILHAASDGFARRAPNSARHSDARSSAIAPKPLSVLPQPVAGAGFEPATSGL